MVCLSTKKIGQHSPKNSSKIGHFLLPNFFLKVEDFPYMMKRLQIADFRQILQFTCDIDIVPTVL